MMAFLRLGVQCAVIDDEGRLLLSRRGDLNTWDLPGGRLDWGEDLLEASAREVAEETGIIPQIERAVGLYYLQGWNRLNIAFAGWPLGGHLLEKTAETRANRYFDPLHLPPMPWNIIALDALAETRHLPRMIETPLHERRRVKRRLALRWLTNFLAGRPEPRFPRFTVQAVALVWEDTHRRLLTSTTRQGRALPRILCDGTAAPWLQLSRLIQSHTAVYPSFRWVGLWQDIGRGEIDLIFATTIEETERVGDLNWSLARNTAFISHEMEYVTRVKSSYHLDAVWFLNHDLRLKPDTIITAEERTR